MPVENSGLTVSRTFVSSRFALQLVGQALDLAESRGFSASVCVVDPSLNVMAFARADAATIHSKETSMRKAMTAASTRRPTGWMSAELGVTLPMASGNTLTNIGGGIPIVLNGEVVGGLGVAGGSVEQDAEVARDTIAGTSS